MKTVNQIVREVNHQCFYSIEDQISDDDYWDEFDEDFFEDKSWDEIDELRDYVFDFVFWYFRRLK
jgi:8-oxo-dGTP pyrophosphatase MutT (NUDIX family)